MLKFLFKKLYSLEGCYFECKTVKLSIHFCSGMGGAVFSVVPSRHAEADLGVDQIGHMSNIKKGMGGKCGRICPGHTLQAC
jgi:hypothetical protein